MEELKWDTAFFGRKTGRVRLVGDATASDIESLRLEMQREGYELVYLFCDSELPAETGMRPVDRKRTYSCVFPRSVASPPGVADFTGSSSELYELAYQAGYMSRFRRDPQIGEENFRRLYREWVDKSVKDADTLVKVCSEDGEVVGFITATIHPEMVTIGLIATAEGYRGRGVGSRLIGSVMAEAARRRLPVEVVTQGDNGKACRFYEGAGFHVKDEVLVYHLW